MLIELIGWLGTGGQMVGLLLNTHKKMSCWIAWLASNMFLITYSVVLGLWPVFTLQLFFVATNIYGWWKWQQDSKKTEKK